MTNDQRLLQLLAISASTAQTVSTATSLTQGATPEEASRIFSRTHELLERGSDGPVNRFNALVRGILGGDAGTGRDLQIRSHGNYAERCSVVVADMTRIAYALIARGVTASDAA